MQVISRGVRTQQLITAIANEFFRHGEKKLVEAELGKPFERIKFDMFEYLAILQQFPYPDIDLWRPHIAFFKYAMTIDRVVLQMESLRRMIKNLDNIGDPDVLADLKRQLVHPNLLPWEVVDHPDFPRWTRQERQAADLGQLKNATLYLFRFPVVRNIMAVTQGLFMLYPEQLPQSNPEWVNRKWRMHTGEATVGANKVVTIGDTESKVGTGGPLAAESDVARNIVVSYTNPANGDTLAELVRRLKKAFIGARGTDALYSTFNDLLHDFEKVLNYTYTQLSASAHDFANNLHKGPMLTDATQCPNGTVPRFVDADGNDVPWNEAVVLDTATGQYRTTGRVQLSKTTCVPTMQVGPSFSARRVSSVRRRRC